MKTSDDPVVRALALLVAKGDITLAETYLPWICGSKAEPKERAKRFVPPTVEEVAEYCHQRKNGIDAESFCSYYASKGWKIGNTKMSDWKAAVHTWEKRRNESSQPTTFDNPNQFWK